MSARFGWQGRIALSFPLAQTTALLVAGQAMKSTNYFNTLILASTDCAASAGTAPKKPDTIAALEYEMLSESPYELTSDELLLAVEVQRQSVKRGELAKFKKEFFSRPHACLRASPLVKSYGWGLHHDARGRVALVGRETRQYQAMAEDDAITKVPGMRSRRAE